MMYDQYDKGKLPSPFREASLSSKDREIFIYNNAEEHPRLVFHEKKNKVFVNCDPKKEKACQFFKFPQFK